MGSMEEVKLKIKEEKKFIEEEKKIIEDEKKAIQDDKIVLDNEWGDIMQKKKEYEQLGNLPDNNALVKEKLDEIEKMEVEKKSLLKTIDNSEARLQELLEKHKLQEDKIHAMKEGYETSIERLKDSRVEEDSSTEALVTDLKCKDVLLSVLQKQCDTSKQTLEDTTKNLEIRNNKNE